MTSPVPVLGWFAGEAGVLYEQTLTGLVVVLEAAGETHWLAWVQRSLEEWRASGATAGHRRAYGGMGSLNDLVLTQPDADRAIATWLDAALDVLRASAYRFSVTAEDDPARFVQTAVPTPSLELHWYRCQNCNHGFATEWNLMAAAATGWASYAVPRLVSERHGDRIAEAASGGNPEYPTAPYEAHVSARYHDLGVTFAEVGQHWKTPCPDCGAINWWYTSAAAF